MFLEAPPRRGIYRHSLAQSRELQMICSQMSIKKNMYIFISLCSQTQCKHDYFFINYRPVPLILYILWSSRNKYLTKITYIIFYIINIFKVFFRFFSLVYIFYIKLCDWICLLNFENLALNLCLSKCGSLSLRLGFQSTRSKLFSP